MERMEQMELMHTEVLCCCGRLALEAGLFPHAFDMLTRALDREPTDPNTLLLLSRAYMQSSDAASVIRMLVNAINAGVTSIASDSRIWTVLALCYDQLDGFMDSLHAVTQALLLESYYSVDADLHVMQCRFFLKQGVHQYPLDALLPYFDKMLESVRVGGAPANVHVEALVTRAQLLYKYAEFEGALTDLQLAMGLLNAEPQDSSSSPFRAGERLAKISYTYLLASVLQFLSSRTEESLKLVEDAIVCFPHTARTVQPLLLASGMMSSLLERDLYATLDRMVLEEPHSAEGSAFLMNYIIARLLLQLDPVRNVYEAYSYYRRALNLDITKPYVWISIGSLYLRLGQINDALSAYTQGSVLALDSTAAAAAAATAAPGSANGAAAAAVGTTNGAASAAAGSGSRSQSMANFNHLFGALAWFGIAQTYLFTRDLPSAVEALSRSARFFAEANNPHQADELHKQIQSLSAYLANPANVINIEYTIPDVPFQLLLDLLLYDDTGAFSVKSRIERSQDDSISRATHVTTAPLSPKAAAAAATAGSKLEGSSGKVERSAAGSRSRNGSVTVFKGSSFSANSLASLINPNVTRGQRNSSTSYEAARSTANSPVLVPPLQQHFTPLLSSNNFGHPYDEGKRTETIPQMASRTTAYYPPQMVPHVGAAGVPSSHGMVPLVFQQNGVAHRPRQMSTYTYYP